MLSNMNVGLLSLAVAITTQAFKLFQPRPFLRHSGSTFIVMPSHQNYKKHSNFTEGVYWR
ncbi:MAG: hypothetical protein ACI9BS_000841 [Candidatus Poriferisodalaceae bacterium]|jgi:hypothetical protein